MSKDIDILLWGVTGMTGREALKYAAKRYANSPEKLRIAIGGRSRSKLEQSLATVAQSYPEVAHWPILTGDSLNQEDMDKIASQVRVVASMVGPFRLYGNCLVDACVRLGTDYVDINGEVTWSAEIVSKYHDQAAKANAFIIPSCGFDCMPTDICAFMAERYVRENLKSDVAYIRGLFKMSMGSIPGGGTLLTFMTEESNATEDTLHNVFLLNPPDAPKRERTIHDGDQTYAEYDKDFKVWTAPFFLNVANTRVVNRSIALRGLSYPYKESMFAQNIFVAWITAVMIGLVVSIMRSSFLRKLIKPLLPQPGTSQTPSEAGIANCFFDAHAIAVSKGPQVKRARVDMHCPHDPGYAGTVRMLIESAVVLALHKPQLLKSAAGGVLTPSSLGDLLVNRLEKNADVTFKTTLL